MHYSKFLVECEIQFFKYYKLHKFCLIKHVSKIYNEGKVKIKSGKVI